jgi:hypothetical protein
LLLSAAMHATRQACREGWFQVIAAGEQMLVTGTYRRLSGLESQSLEAYLPHSQRGLARSGA